MTTNKTPIQELIKYFEYVKTQNVNPKEIDYLNEVIMAIDTFKQKEKAFAFDCFEAGKLYGIDLCLSIEDAVETREPKFDEFYSKYAEQHAD